MAKREKKSLSSLIERKIDTSEIEAAAMKVHKKVEPKPKKKIVEKPKKEQVIRVSVDTPRDLYMLLKETAFEEDIKSLRHLYLHCAKEYLKAKGKL